MSKVGGNSGLVFLSQEETGSVLVRYRLKVSLVDEVMAVSGKSKAFGRNAEISCLLLQKMI